MSLTIKIIYKVINKRGIYFKDLMHLMDIVIICLSFTCLFLYADRSRLVGTFLKRLESASHNEFINYFHLFYSDWTFTLLAALLVFLATLRLWKLLKFLLIIRVVEKTLVLCSKPIFCVCLWQITVLLSYGIAGVILFGDYSYSFRKLQSSVITLLMRSLGFDQSFSTDSLKTPLQFIYYVSFMIINLLIYTLYVAIITISYYDAELCYSNTEDYSVIDYLKEKFNFYFNLIKVRIRNHRFRGGEETVEENLVYAKLDEHRFAKCLTSPKSKMEAMILVTLCILRNLRKPKSKNLDFDDEDLIKNTIVGLFREDSSTTNDIFYISNLQEFEKTLVDDEVFIKMYKIVDFLITKRTEKKAKRQNFFYERVCQLQKSKMEQMNNHLNLMSKIVSQIEFNI